MSKDPKFLEGGWKCLSKMFNTKVPLNVKICVLGRYLKEFVQTSKQIKLLDFWTFSNQTIALYWKRSMDTLSLKIWKQEISDCIGMKRITYIAMDKQ